MTAPSRRSPGQLGEVTALSPTAGRRVVLVVASTTPVPRTGESHESSTSSGSRPAPAAVDRLRRLSYRPSGYGRRHDLLLGGGVASPSRPTRGRAVRCWSLTPSSPAFGPGASS